MPDFLLLEAHPVDILYVSKCDGGGHHLASMFSKREAENTHLVTPEMQVFHCVRI